MKKLVTALLSVVASGIALAQAPAPAESKMAVVLEGIVLTARGAPLAARTVFTFAVDDETRRVVAFAGITADGRMLVIDRKNHPNALTDAKGRFRITFSKAIGVVKSGDTYVVGGKYAGFTLGVYPKENIASMPLETKPAILGPGPGQAAPAWTIDGNVLRVQFGTLVMP